MDAKLRQSASSTKVCKKERRNGCKSSSSSSSLSSTTTSSLMSILRPKVYITDTSSFKSLVQELTGRSNYPLPPVSAAATSASSSIPNLSESQDYTDHVEGSSSDVTTGTGAHFFSCYDDDAVAGEVVIGGAGEGSYGDVMHDGMDLLTYRLLESWLLDTNHRGNDHVVTN